MNNPDREEPNPLQKLGNLKMMTKQSAEAPDAGGENGQSVNSSQSSQINKNESTDELVPDIKKLALGTPYITAAIMDYVFTGERTAILEVIHEFALVLNEISPGTWSKLFDEMVLLGCSRSK
jgi:hypothetical protein